MGCFSEVSDGPCCFHLQSQFSHLPNFKLKREVSKLLCNIDNAASFYDISTWNQNPLQTVVPRVVRNVPARRAIRRLITLFRHAYSGFYLEPVEFNLHSITYFFKINFKIILASTPSSFRRSLPFVLPHPPTYYAGVKSGRLLRRNVTASCFLSLHFGVADNLTSP
jgi:hypothetical protein